MKYTLFFLMAFFCWLAAFAAPDDTLHITTHHKLTVVTDPSKGNNPYKSWGTFPSKKTPVRKIMMFVKFACPDTMRCADWDYSDRISIKRTGGVNGVEQNYELGRMLTPYGGAFGKNWSFDFELDVTDFSILLRDSVEIEYNHSGWEPNEDRGWAITIEFLVIKGRPVNEPISIQKIYDDGYLYGNSEQPIEEKLSAVSFASAKNASFARLRVVQTGHGMDKPDGCAEFCDKWREIYFDGKLVEKKQMWKKCGDNPLYPQAGTWLIDRGNWCPGDLVQPDIYDLTIKRPSHTVDINMQPYTASEVQANIVISAYLIQYKKNNTANDAAIEDILVPSNKYSYQRINPAAAGALVKIKNNGNKPVSSLLIEYGTEGFPKNKFTWNGLLAGNQTTLLTLPGTFNFKKGINNYTVRILKTNNKNDAYAADNSLTTSFTAPPVHDSVIVFYLLTNNQPQHNAYLLKNNKGEVFGERKTGSLNANTLYRDTFHLPPGAYHLALTDTAGDGLEFWFNRRGGRGLAKLLDGNNRLLQAFESDCGLGWEYNFVVGPQPDAIDEGKISIGLFPTRTMDVTTLDYFSNKTEEVVVKLVTDPGGIVVEEHIYKDLKEGIFTYDLTRYPKGRFYLKVIINGEEKFNKRVRYRE